MALSNKFHCWNNDGTGYFCWDAFARNMPQTIKKEFIGFKTLKWNWKVVFLISLFFYFYSSHFPISL